VAASPPMFHVKLRIPARASPEQPNIGATSKRSQAHYHVLARGSPFRTHSSTNPLAVAPQHLARINPDIQSVPALTPGSDPSDQCRALSTDPLHQMHRVSLRTVVSGEGIRGALELQDASLMPSHGAASPCEYVRDSACVLEPGDSHTAILLESTTAHKNPYVHDDCIRPGTSPREPPAPNRPPRGNGPNRRPGLRPIGMSERPRDQ
jgi:hypothetical protein